MQDVSLVKGSIDKQLLPWFLLGLRSPKLHDRLIVFYITSFEACNKEAIILEDNVREGEKTSSVTSIPLIVGSKDSKASSKNLKETSKDVKGMSVDELADVKVARLNPQAKCVAQRDTQGNAHLYPRRDMVWC